MPPLGVKPPESILAHDFPEEVSSGEGFLIHQQSVVVRGQVEKVEMATHELGAVIPHFDDPSIPQLVINQLDFGHFFIGFDDC